MTPEGTSVALGRLARLRGVDKDRAPCHQIVREFDQTSPIEEEPVNVDDELLNIKDMYRRLTDADIAGGNIYDELFFTHNMDPFTTTGTRRLQWGEQQVMASHNYLNTMTSTKKNMKQITFTQDAGGQLSWIADLGVAFTTINKAASPLQSEKWDAKRQLSDATKILKALVATRKHFIARASKNEQTQTIETKRDHARNPMWLLGEYAPAWMQRLDRDALVKYAPSDIFFFCRLHFIIFIGAISVPRNSTFLLDVAMLTVITENRKGRRS